MKILIWKLVAAALLGSALAAGAAAAEDFKLYPGAELYTPPDTEQTRQFMDALRPGTKITAFITHDSFDKVVQFYKGFGREYMNPKAPTDAKLPNGQQIRKSFLILDGAPDVVSSHKWIRVQHPFVGKISIEAGAPQYGDVRDVTEILLTEKKPVSKETDRQDSK